MKAYCYMCGKDVDVVPTERECTTEFKHEQVYYVEQVCLCPHCGEELYVGELHDRNLNALYDAYRERKGLISYAAVKELARKYKISRQNMSLLLGWGEHTFEKFCEGYIPTRMYSDEMMRLFVEEYFEKILEQNKEAIPLSAYKVAKQGLRIQRIEYFAPSADRVEVKFNQPVAYEFSNVALAA
ncbi:MAG TPA: hypothetical protein IAD51_04955 [Candidatus Limadaptatus stercorigallinarum]|uniref:YgiT-type zinc finger protein n=1 Tax=Candidatus Limadaptatus stercorigallinarum TaxID=2840845 RepID=A0A9D1L355_9FIRM|nr:hypothetical protein [Candidatus Limadaptatus stercorigallinarum]